MLAPANYGFCIRSSVCLQARKKVSQCTFKCELRVMETSDWVTHTSPLSCFCLRTNWGFCSGSRRFYSCSVELFLCKIQWFIKPWKGHVLTLRGHPAPQPDTVKFTHRHIRCKFTSALNHVCVEIFSVYCVNTHGLRLSSSSAIRRIYSRVFWAIV